MGLNSQKSNSEEDQVNQDTEDTEDKGQNTDTESKDGKSGADDSEDGKGSEDKDSEEFNESDYFKNPDKVPASHKKVYKRMQAQFTKRMQMAGRVIKEAEAFNALMQDEQFREWLEDREGNRSSKSRSRSHKKDEDDDDDEDTDDDNKPLTRKEFLRMREEERKLSRREREEYEQEQARREQAREFKKNYPDWRKYWPTMEELLEESPKLSFERAYKLAKLDEEEDEEDSDNEDTRKERKSRASASQKPSRTDARSPQKKGKMSFQEAFVLAKRKLGM